ncbi:MAG: ABC transporter ATP-binding protein [Chloroflexi bacterium]|nr:ABC transporter ATP-binding protein [Chloroflexota bacterium]
MKKFGSLVAVDGVDLDVEERELFGLLGPNGAGKTSLFRVITAVSPATAGKAWVAGKDVAEEPRAVKSIIGVVPQQDNLDPDLTVVQNLVTFARYFDIPKRTAMTRVEELLSLVQLQEKRNEQVDRLSGGMRRRLLIARALVNQPKVLVLDEPTVGLDPQAKHLVWQKLRSLKDLGVTQLLCTQNMDEAERLCDRIAIMHQGKIIAQDTPARLIAAYGGKRIVEARPRQDDRDWLVETLRRQGLEFQEVEDTFYIFQTDGEVLDQRLVASLDRFAHHVPTLEDVFLRLTGRSLGE